MPARLWPLPIRILVIAPVLLVSALLWVALLAAFAAIAVSLAVLMLIYLFVRLMTGGR